MTIVDPFTAEAFVEDGLIVRPFRPEVPLSFGAIYPRNRPRSYLVQDFVAAAEAERDILLRRHTGRIPGDDAAKRAEKAR